MVFSKFDPDKLLSLAITEPQKIVLAEIINTPIAIFSYYSFGEWVYRNVPRHDTTSILDHHGYCSELIIKNYYKLKSNLSNKNIGLSEYATQDEGNQKIQFIVVHYLYMALYYCYIAITQDDFQALLLLNILSKKYGINKITKNNLKSGKLTDEQWSQVEEAKEFINETIKPHIVVKYPKTHHMK